MGEQEIQMFARALESAQPGAGQTVMALASDPRGMEVIMALFQVFVQAESQMGPGAGERAVIEAMMQNGLLPGAGAGPPPQGAPPPPPPPGPPASPGAMPMPGQPPPGAPPPPGVPPEMAQGQPTQGPPPEGPRPAPREVKRRPVKAPPKYQLPKLDESRWKKKMPSIDHVYRIARAGQTMWQSRDDRVKEDVACWKGEMANLLPGGGEAASVGRLVHQRLTPYSYVERVTTTATWQNDRVEMDMPFRADDDKHVSATQATENWLRTQREHDSQKWRRRAEYGDPQPPLERVEAQGMALLGGVGWYWEVRPDDEAYPFCAKYVPWNELYPVGGEVTRQYIIPLAQLRAEVPEVDEYYADFDGDENQKCRVIGWSDKDGYRHGLCWQEEGWSYEPPEGTRKDRWIKAPRAVLGLGFPFYNLRIWNSAPPVEETGDHYRKWVGVGVLTRAVPHFKLVNFVGEMALKGFLRSVAPPTLQTHQPGTDLNKVPVLDLDPEARNFGFNGDDVKMLGMAGTGSPDGQTTLSMLASDQADLVPPVMSGGRAGNSGFQQMQAEQAAQAVTVGPIMDAMERMYEDMFRQRAQLALRFGKNGENKDIEYFSEYPYRDYRKRQGGYAALKPGDIELAGVDCEVRYKRMSPAEEAAQATMLVQLVNAHLMSTEEALKRRGVREPEREWLKILRDGAMMNPRVLMSLVGSAIMESGDEMLINAWDEAGMLEALKGGGGSEPAQPGVASAAGAAAPQQPADVAQPGASNAYAA